MDSRVTKEISGLLDIGFYLKLFFISGAALGLLVTPFYGYKYLVEQNILYFVAVCLLIPIVNGIFVTIYGVVGYAAYRFMFKNNLLGFDKIKLIDDRSSDDNPG